MSRGIVVAMTYRGLQWAEHVGKMVETRNEYRILAGKPPEKFT